MKRTRSLAIISSDQEAHLAERDAKVAAEVTDDDETAKYVTDIISGKAKVGIMTPELYDHLSRLVSRCRKNIIEYRKQIAAWKKKNQKISESIRELKKKIAQSFTESKTLHSCLKSNTETGDALTVYFKNAEIAADSLKLDEATLRKEQSCIVMNDAHIGLLTRMIEREELYVSKASIFLL
jgi:membrane-associated HD superfamily phosphohydrolase